MDKGLGPDPTARDPRPAAPGMLEETSAGEVEPQLPYVEEEATVTLSQWQLGWRRFRRNKLAIVCIVVLAIILLSVIFAPLLTPYNYHEIELTQRLQPPSIHHWMGTDNLGRDEFTRVLYGGRVSIFVGLAVALVASIIGTTIGALAGFYGGWLDNLLMRITDLFLAIPFLVTLIIASAALGGSVSSIVIILALFFWMPDARIVRGVFLSLKEKEFVEAARASGATNKRIIGQLIPNTMGPIVVNTTLSVVAAILTESVLSFLGFGIQPPVPTWGNLIDDAAGFIYSASWLLFFPGLAILITVLCVNFIGDGLRDAFDPQQKIGAEE
jgi:peptide/nickel transport system permease protein